MPLRRIFAEIRKTLNAGRVKAAAEEAPEPDLPVGPTSPEVRQRVWEDMPDREKEGANSERVIKRDVQERGRMGERPGRRSR